MRCEEYQAILDEYFDGELNDSAGLPVSRHVAMCPACASVLQKLKDERDFYSDHKMEARIHPEAWAKVSARIATETQTLSFAPRKHVSLRSFLRLPQVNGWVTAALVFFAIAMTAAFMTYLQTRDNWMPATVTKAPASQSGQPAVVNTADAPETIADNSERRRNKRDSRVVMTAALHSRPLVRTRPTDRAKSPNQLVREAEQKYLAAIAMLSREAERKRSGQNAESRATLDQALASIDRTIAGTRQAVRKHPKDPMAVQYMLTAYAKKMDVLKQIVDD
jgi:hypothetical protein